MDTTPIYRKISSKIRLLILEGKYKPGDKLPTIRELTTEWNCTTGTAQRAYQELALQGLVVSRPGQGTLVVSKSSVMQDTPMRRAALVHRAESFLLEALNSGHSADEIESAIQTAMDRWRSMEKEPEQPQANTVRFIGSHDLAITWISSHFSDILPGNSLQITFTGSMGGLRALADRNADLAGCHLWDEESSEYNIPYIKKLFPNQKMTLVTLAHRRLGLILPVGNPQKITGLRDLIKPGVVFINRQAGSGTRVWLDSQLRLLGIDPSQFEGYVNEKATHSEVAQVIAEGNANAGIGLEASARHFGLDFIFLARERYDLVTYQNKMDSVPIASLVKWLGTSDAKRAIRDLGGYDTSEIGKIIQLN